MKVKHLATVALVSVAARIAFGDGTPAAPRTEYELLRTIPKERLHRLMWDRPDASGFMGSNRQAGRWIEAGTQRGSCRSHLCRRPRRSRGGRRRLARG